MTAEIIITEGASQPNATTTELSLELTPHHLIHDAHIALDDLHYLGAYVLVHIIRHRDSMLSVLAELYSSINCLKEALLIDASNDEVALVDGFGTLSRGADADGREGETNTGEEAAFFWQCT